MVTRNFLRRLLSASLARRSKTPYNLFASNESTRSWPEAFLTYQIKSNFMVAPTALLVPLSVVKMLPHAGNSASCSFSHWRKAGLETEITELVETAALELFDVALFEVGRA
jgi:hypothetical protein